MNMKKTIALALLALGLACGSTRADPRLMWWDGTNLFAINSGTSTNDTTNLVMKVSGGAPEASSTNITGTSTLAGNAYAYVSVSCTMITITGAGADVTVVYE